MHTQKGFTLVELAIVMIIIGLLIGGVLKGQELIENAKVTATISQVKGYQAALNTFRDTYGATPGDMLNAQTRLAGCTAAGNNCSNGNGNSLIRFGETLGTTVTGAATNPDSEATNVANDDETSNAWKHMALADLITGINPAADLTTAEIAWAESHPSSSLRGGYELFYDTDLTGDGSLSGLVLRMSNGGLVSGGMGRAGAAPASGVQAANMDRKLDDGRPLTGSVLGGGVDCTPDGAARDTASSYNEQSDQKNCVPMFLIDG